MYDITELFRNFHHIITDSCVLFAHNRSLLILDDVWSPKVAKTFDVQCRVLVTTRDSSITDQVTGKPCVYFICCVFFFFWGGGFMSMK